MKKAGILLGLIVILSVVLAACGGNSTDNGSPSEQTTQVETAKTESPKEEAKTSDEAKSSETKVVKYLDQEYTLPASAERIVITGALEAMEDAILMDIHPVGAVTVSGEFPSLFTSITDQAVSVGEKTEPDFEKILSLEPDVILASSKFDPAVVEKLSKIATTIPYSHVSTNWEANVILLGELSGKQDKAVEIINDYKSTLESVKTELGDELKDKSAAVVRIRAGEVKVYPTTVYFNPVVYEDLGLAVPAEVEAAKAQESLSLEKLAEMNPDILVVQFSPDENKDNPNALQDFENNPIVSSLDAVKNGNMYVNLVDPLAQGGTAYSKVAFLNALIEKLK